MAKNMLKNLGRFELLELIYNMRKEIAEMTNSTVGAVAMRIARLKRKLRIMYERENKL